MNNKPLIKVLLLYLVYFVSFIFIRKRNRYTFGGPMGTFRDNAKYLFLYAMEHTDADVAWVTSSRRLVSELQDRGLRAYQVRSFKGIWHALTSKYWFYNSYLSDIDFSLSGGAITINLWHGVGIKCIERNLKSSYWGNIRQHPTVDYFLRHPHQYIRPRYVLSSNDFQSEFFASSFDIPKHRCLEFGYPRNWILKATEEERMHFIEMYETEETVEWVERLRKNLAEKVYQKVMIYMPTWRDSQRDLFTQSMDLHRLNEALVARKELLILKPHPMMYGFDNDFDYSNIVLLDKFIDVYEILPYVNVLITDYSSVIYDFLIMGKEVVIGTEKPMCDRSVILYIYDYNEYVKESREFYYPYDENNVGRRVYNFDELLKVITEGDYGLSYKDCCYLVDRFWGESQSYDSSRKLLDFVATGRR